ncbi:MAG: DNA internalization-related competence protein ComEC/Rec2 [Actinomycetota bacterium]|nr:DNA internalization-related competence protein ComEC/Rec2 [Actinomycetota bacterium]
MWSLLALLAAATLAEPLGGAGPLPSAVILAAGSVLAAVAPRLPSRSRSAAAAVAVVAVAAAAGGIRVARFERGPLIDLARSGGTREMIAVVIAEPQVDGERWWTLVRVDRVGTRGSRERALLRGRGRPPELGGVWSGQAGASPVPRHGFGVHLRRRYTAVRLHPRVWRAVGEPRGLTRVSNEVRERIRAAAGAALPPAHAGLATGLVTGDTRLLPDEHEQMLRDSGLTHLVAVSGSNVSLVGLGVALLAGAVGIGAVGRRRATAAALVWFAFMTRWEPSVLRASAMGALVLLAAFRGRLVDLRHALAVALLVLVLVDPGIAGATGLLLSAAATAGVLVLAPLIAARLGSLPARIADVVAMTLGAQLAVAPLLLATAGEVPLASLPANLVAVPAAAVAAGLATAASALATAHPMLGAPFFALARPPLAVVLGAAERLRNWGGVISLQRPVTLLLLAAVTAWILTRRASRARQIAVALVVASLVGVLFPGVALRRPVRGLVVTAIDVGQGDAILVEAPGARVLVDGGPDAKAGRWLRRAAKRHLDLVVLSHPHADHANGLPTVLTQARVGALWLPALPSDLPSVAQLLHEAESRKVPVAHPTAGAGATIGGLRLDVLAPPAGRPYRWADSEENETSIVLRLAWGGRVALLTGDVERAAQHDLLATPARLRAGLLKVPHHGGATSDPRFLLAAQSQVTVVSVGRDNPYGHPRREVLDVLSRGGSQVRRTDREGTLRIEVPPSNPEMATAPAPLVLLARPPLRTVGAVAEGTGADARRAGAEGGGRARKISATGCPIRSRSHAPASSCLPHHRRRRAAPPAGARAPPHRAACC